MHLDSAALHLDRVLRGMELEFVQNASSASRFRCAASRSRASHYKIEKRWILSCEHDVSIFFYFALLMANAQKKLRDISELFIELMSRFELPTSSLPMRCATNCATSASTNDTIH